MTRSQASILVDLALDSGAELFHDPSGTEYATVPVGDHVETHSIRSTAFANWLRHAYLKATKAGPSGQSVADASATLSAVARFGDGARTHVVSVRVASAGDALYLDLADDHWRVVEIAPDGWRVLDRSPVRFRRPPAMYSLPLPLRATERPGGLELLRAHLNLADDTAWRLVAGWLVGASRPTGPFPLLALHGEQGSGKSWAARLLRAVLDPNRSPLRSDPRDLDALMIAARNGWIPVFDNLSAMPTWVSDGLCRLATGGGLSKRMLYSDADETILDATRPVIIDGIPDLTTKGDLADRALNVELPRIKEDRRRTETEIWRAFQSDHPAILGGLLDVVSLALGALPNTRLERLPRMADFALWVHAAEPALGWPIGSFLSAYLDNRSASHELVVEASPLAIAVRELAKESGFEGTATQLLDRLATRVGEPQGQPLAKRGGLPTSPRTLSDALRRLAPDLHEVGIEVTYFRTTDRGHRRVIRIDAGGPPSTGFQRPNRPKGDGPSEVQRAPRSTVGGVDGQGDSRVAAHADASDASDAASSVCPDCGHPMVRLAGLRPVCTNGPGHRGPKNGASVPAWPA